MSIKNEFARFDVTLEAFVAAANDPADASTIHEIGEMQGSVLAFQGLWSLLLRSSENWTLRFREALFVRLARCVWDGREGASIERVSWSKKKGYMVTLARAIIDEGESAVATSKSYISDAIDAWFKPALDEVKKTALSTRTKVTNASEFDQSLRRMFEMCNNLIQVLLVRTEDLHSFFPPEFEVPNLIAKSILVSIESAVSTALFAPIRELEPPRNLAADLRCQCL